MDTTIHAREKTGIVLFILTLATTVIIAAGLIWVTMSDEASDWVTGFASADTGWTQNITGRAYSMPSGQIEDHIRESQKAMQEQVRQSQERLDDLLKRN